MATCCHHRCTWGDYTGRGLFRRLGIGEADFQAIAKMTGDDCALLLRLSAFGLHIMSPMSFSHATVPSAAAGWATCGHGASLGGGRDSDASDGEDSGCASNASTAQVRWLCCHTAIDSLL